MDYGKITSDYSVSFSRRYSIPEDWTADQTREFHAAKYAELREEVEPLAQKEFDERFEQSYLSRGAND